MKDKFARELVQQFNDSALRTCKALAEEIAGRGSKVQERLDKERKEVQDAFSQMSAHANNALERIAALEKDLAEFKESCKPVCKACGQKIQDGIRVGQIETLAAGLKRGKKDKS